MKFEKLFVAIKINFKIDSINLFLVNYILILMNRIWFKWNIKRKFYSL